MPFLIVGLTGTFGSGKSTVGRLFKTFGAQKVINSDRLVDEAFKPSHPVRRRINSLFGKRASRKQIAQEVFRSRAKRRRLEAIIHPYVFCRIASELKRISGQKRARLPQAKRIVVIEAPLLFETGFERTCDKTVVVCAGERNIIRRLRRLGFRASDVRRRLRAQLPERAKKRRADFVILNTGTKAVLKRRAKQIWKELYADVPT